MAKDKLILHRFMSRVEYIMYQSGEVLHNDTDHYKGGQGGFRKTSNRLCRCFRSLQHRTFPNG